MADTLYLKIDKNEFIAVMGPNGSGKTTFINIIGQLAPCGNTQALVE